MELVIIPLSLLIVGGLGYAVGHRKGYGKGYGKGWSDGYTQCAQDNNVEVRLPWPGPRR